MIKQTERGWVDLSNLVYSSRKSVNWDMSIGKTVDFQYDDIVATLTITGRADDVQYVYIDIPGYVQHRKIYVGQIRHGQLGNVVGQITPDFKYNINDIVNDLLITDMYKESGYKYCNYICTHDGHSGVIREDHLRRGHGCPICRNLIGEKCVATYLLEHNISFVQQHYFDDCRYKRVLYFDFYLNDFNACIEYDGIQHFKPVDFAGKGQEWANEQFESLMLRDEIKNKYCKNNNIPLCRIKYTQNIQETLDDFLKSLQYDNTTK